MKKILLFIILSLLLIDCQKKNIVSNKLINELSLINETKGNYIPDVLYNVLFVKLDNGKYLRTNGDELFSIYKKNYNNIKYYDFLNKILNQNMVLKHNFIDNNAFNLDQNLAQQNIAYLVKKFSIDNENGTYKFDASLNNDYNSILYCFFKSGYEISFDDYSGIFIMKK
ncbi:hypothetical protein [Chryseobacterium indoltheticum]|uniref:hypothetical protein n=1 Tax=Chryseobacterium indoltheticum TaxID=254 RepID=UPI0028EF7578|nr:hypothetical protein [Chryseobacterium indoltheticum]